MQTIYLDHNATTPVLPEVAEVLDAAHRAGYANPASQHAAGRRARRVVEEARRRIGELLGADVGSIRPDHVIFTSGGTEANNLALHTERCDASHYLISSVEHPSIRGPAERLRLQGHVVETIPVDRRGLIDPQEVAARLRPTTRLVSVMLGNNETGVLQPAAEIAALCRARGVRLHTDAVQAVGKIPVHFRELGVDALTAAAHKLHGPVGIGCLLVRADALPEPQLAGGFQQGGLRPGTEPVALVLGFAAALEAWYREAAVRTARLAALRDEFESRLAAVVPQAVFHGRAAPRLPQTSCVAFVGVDRQAMLLALDQAGVCCSTGSACASGSSEPSPTLVAMGCPTAELQSSLRFSVGTLTTTAEIAEAVERIRRVDHELRRQNERRKMPVAGR